MRGSSTITELSDTELDQVAGGGGFFKEVKEAFKRHEEGEKHFEKKDFDFKKFDDFDKREKKDVKKDFDDFDRGEKKGFKKDC